MAFLWNVPYVGPNKFDCLRAPDAFTVKVLGGWEIQAVVVFKQARMTDSRLDGGVFAAVIMYPLECAKAPGGGFPQS
ncbi:unnamed protein product [Fusarium venenatum]|uniref:Uncharacterized protein n=1 Tax=Fusarium venenatum TaxID=56646 RepID=A0A2L2TV59_9HYPO|nr:uncharacterized protein FVRRES_08253 [Fusarium venenatum]CEI68176.1 unnamed protein product [Fusarium venenatum]